MRSYDEYKHIVEKALTDKLPKTEPHAVTVYEAMKYSLTNGGKRLRPCLLLASSDFAGGDTAEAVTYACALEFIHTYSLIHDDLPAMDDDELRRGRPTNHRVYGEAMAILAGDGLLSSAFEIMSDELIRHVDDLDAMRRHALAQHEIVTAAGIHGMVAGQVCDIENEYAECSADTVEFIEKNKTGALISAPIRAGLKLSGAGDKLISDFTFYADCIGQAFQISDDILDFTSTPEELGKSPGKDEEQGKCNYVLVHGMDEAKDRLHELTEMAVDALGDYGEDADFFRELSRRLEARKA